MYADEKTEGERELMWPGSAHVTRIEPAFLTCITTVLACSGGISDLFMVDSADDSRPRRTVCVSWHRRCHRCRGGCAEVKQYIQYSMVSKHHEEMGAGYG